MTKRKHRLGLSANSKMLVTLVAMDSAKQCMETFPKNKNQNKHDTCLRAVLRLTEKSIREKRIRASDMKRILELTGLNCHTEKHPDACGAGTNYFQENFMNTMVRGRVNPGTGISGRRKKRSR